MKDVTDDGVRRRLTGNPTLAATATIFMYPEILKEVYSECTDKSLSWFEISNATKAQIVERCNRDIRMAYPDNPGPFLIHQDFVRWKRIIRIFRSKRTVRMRKP